MPKQKRQIDGRFRISMNRQPWFDFTLQKGHIYGMYKGEFYVSAGEPVERMRDHIWIYSVSEKTRDGYIWAKKPVYRGEEVSRLIMEKVRERGGCGIEFSPIRPDLHWTAKTRPDANSGGVWTGAKTKPPRMETMSQSRKGHITICPKPEGVHKPWVSKDETRGGRACKWTDSAQYFQNAVTVKEKEVVYSFTEADKQSRKARRQAEADRWEAACDRM